MFHGTAERRLTLTLLFALVAAAAFLVRVPSIAEPLGIDQSLWASAARGMAHGQRLYRDVWEQRPPGIYWIYVTAFRVLGWRPGTLAWLDVLASAATCLLLSRIAARLADEVTGSLVAAIFATLTMPAWLYNNGGLLERSICETFILPGIALAAWGVVTVRERRSLVAAAVAGLAAGMAVVLKPNAGLYFPVLLVWLALYRNGVPLVRVLVVAAIGAAVLPVAALVWLWRLDLLHDARVAVVDFNRFYVSQGFTPGGYALVFSKAVWLRIKTDPLWLSGIFASFVAVWGLIRRRSLPPLPALGLLWGAAAVLVIVVNGAALFNSYFMNALPPLSLMAAWMLVECARATRGRQVIAVATVAGMVFLLVHRNYTDRVFGWASLDFARLRGSDPVEYLEHFGGYDNGRGYSARANSELAEYVARHTAPEERIFLFGISGAGVYFGSDRLTAHRFLRVNFFVSSDFPDPEFRLGPVLADLAARRPRYLIFEQLHGQSAMARAADNLPNDPSVQALLRDYRLETRIEDFTLYRRSD